jgi:hypothetical protein
MLRFPGAWSQKVADAYVQRHVPPNHGNQELKYKRTIG